FFLTRGASKPDETPSPQGNLGGEPPKRPLDLAYIPAEAGAAFMVNPRQLLQAPLAKALPLGSTDDMVKEFGIKPEQIEQVIVLLQPGSAPRPESSQPPKD